MGILGFLSPLSQSECGRTYDQLVSTMCSTSLPKFHQLFLWSIVHPLSTFHGNLCLIIKVILPRQTGKDEALVEVTAATTTAGKQTALD